MDADAHAAWKCLLAVAQLCDTTIRHYETGSLSLDTRDKYLNFGVEALQILVLAIPCNRCYTAIKDRGLAAALRAVDCVTVADCVNKGRTQVLVELLYAAAPTTREPETPAGGTEDGKDDAADAAGATGVSSVYNNGADTLTADDLACVASDAWHVWTATPPQRPLKLRIQQQAQTLDPETLWMFLQAVLRVLGSVALECMVEQDRVQHGQVPTDRAHALRRWLLAAGSHPGQAANA